SSWDQLLKANGGKAPTIKTITRPRAANEFPVAPGTPLNPPNFVKTPESTPFSQNPIKATTQSLTGLPRAFTRAVAETGMSVAQAVLPKSTPNETLTINPRNKIQSTIFGTDPLESLATKIANLEANGLSLPIATALVIG